MASLAEVYRARVTLKNRSVGDGIGNVLPAPSHSPAGASVLASARESFLRGDFERCVADLGGRTFADARLGAQALLVQARGLLRLQRPAEVVDLLTPVLETFSAVDDVCTARMIHGMAMARADSPDQGMQLLIGVEKYADANRADQAVKVEIAYFRAVTHWLKHEYNDASRFALVAERAKLDVVSVRAMELLAFIALATSQFSEALQLFYRAQKAYALCRGRDLGLATQIICQIAALELNLKCATVPGSHTAPGGRTIPGASFGPAIPTPARMQMVSVDAWLYALDGDAQSAVRKVHEAMNLSSTQAWRVWALSNAAALSHAIGEFAHARYFADQAGSIVPSVKWNDTTDEERIGLLRLAEAYAAVKPEAAAGMLRQYDSITTPMDATRLLRERNADPRMAGWDAHVRGLVARVSGEPARAGEYFRRSAELFLSCGYLWRAALALIELDATPVNAKDEFALERAAKLVRDNFPASFLARRLGPWGRAYCDPVAGKLSPGQREILHLLLQGKTPTEVSTQTKRASGTVRKHIEHIYDIFGTHSHRELFTACVRRGIWSVDPDSERLRRTS